MISKIIKIQLYCNKCQCC